MKATNLIITISLMSILTAYGQAPETDAAAKTEIGKLSFIVGNWEGNGWMMGRDGKKRLFTQTENIQFKLDSTAILIEGVGMDSVKIIHNALAVIRFNKDENNYSFNSYLSNGRGGVFKAELIDDKLYWYPNENMRYIIYLNEKRQWHETGEIKRQTDWFQFFEMTLDKILAPAIQPQKSTR